MKSDLSVLEQPASSPFQLSKLSTIGMMKTLLLCLLPGIIVSIWFFGVGILINLLIAVTAGIIFESLALLLQRREIVSSLKDYSAIVTGALFAVSIPLGLPWQLVVAGMAFAIFIAKHAYGGLGQNCFNPAMCGYLFLLLSYPLDMTIWQVPMISSMGESLSPFSWEGLNQSFQASFSGVTATSENRTALIDGMAKATPLIETKMATQAALLTAIENNEPLFTQESNTAWEFINLANLMGGLVLIKLGIIRWHIPFAVLIGLVTMSVLFYSEGGANIVGTPYLHLFNGATMLAAFFIATDPVSAASTKNGRIIYGLLIGVSIFSIRVWGSYLDGVAIAVIIANFFAPAFDHFFRPTVHGHISYKTRLLTILRHGFSRE